MSHQSDLIAEDILAYLKQHEEKDLLRFITCGSVDDGKSTLIGCLLYESKMIFEDQLAAIERDSKTFGTTGGKIDYALLMDGLQSEREQGITIDVAYRYFSTDKRKFIIADTPGHEQYTRNMATGASTAQLAILLIDARHGLMVQTRRHSFICDLLGIKHFVVAINKMDLVDYSEEKYEEIKAQYLEFAKGLSIDPANIYFTPISALNGDNVVKRSDEMPWYEGETLMHTLEHVKIGQDKNFVDMRLPVQYVNRPNLDFRGFCGTLAAGVVKPGDAIKALPSGKTSKVERVVTYDGDLDIAYPGEAITLTLEDEIDISRGDMIVKSDDETAQLSNQFNAHIVWMSEEPLRVGQQYDFKVGTAYSSGYISKIHYRIDVNTLEHEEAEKIILNRIALCKIELTQPVAFDDYKRVRETGSFIVIDRLSNATLAAGMITMQDVEGDDGELNVDRIVRMGQKNQTSWLISLEGSVADKQAALETALFREGRHTYSVDTAALGEHAGAVINALIDAGLTVIAVGGLPSDLSDVAKAHTKALSDASLGMDQLVKISMASAEG
ncbi:MAG: sulfate adenylyltransferase subunit CysN [Pseudomonadota bacterium]|nr:sulfate adenylyltransferase subunit CysN [Pseudomonadota bacterium]